MAPSRFLRCVALCAAVAAAAAAGSGAADTPPSHAAVTAFNRYIVQFNKTYAGSEEYLQRLSAFTANVRDIAERNAAAGGATTFAVNKFSDLTPEEFRAKYTGFRPSPAHAAAKAAAPSAPVPDVAEEAFLASSTVVDWRKKGYVTPVKNQGQCGSCWAFSATEQIESDWIMAGKPKQILAPQQIVSCDTVDEGCNGGDTPTAYDYVKKAGGMMSEKSYPYRAQDGRCDFHNGDVVANITGFSYVSKKASEEAKLQKYLMATGPVSVCVATNGWQSYQSGVLKRNCGGAADVDHCVQIAGIARNTEHGDYYIVRNSWAEDWGVKGYIYVEAGTNTCDIAGEATITTPR